MKKVELKASKKIESPLAKYNAVGQLFCILCNQLVKNEMVWTGHVSGRVHRDNLLQLKSKKRQLHDANSTETGTPPPKIKKDGEDADLRNRQSETDHNFKTPLPVPSSSHMISSKVKESGEADSNDGRTEPEEGSTDMDTDGDESNGPSLHIGEEKTNALPEGFFDDPKMDAKARGLEYRKPEEIEWENFVREIASEEAKSSSMRVVDEEASTVSRELDEVEEQMMHWQKVIDLERKAQEVKKQKLVQTHKAIPVDENENDEEEYEEELDWRSKRH